MNTSFPTSLTTFDLCPLQFQSYHFSTSPPDEDEDMDEEEDDLEDEEEDEIED